MTLDSLNPYPRFTHQVVAPVCGVIAFFTNKYSWPATRWCWHLTAAEVDVAVLHFIT